MQMDIEKVLQILERRYQDQISALRAISNTRDPYLTLISCLLSLRTKDEVTARASKRLFALAKKTADMIKNKKKDI